MEVLIENLILQYYFTVISVQFWIVLEYYPFTLLQYNTEVLLYCNAHNKLTVQYCIKVNVNFFFSNIYSRYYIDGGSTKRPILSPLLTPKLFPYRQQPKPRGDGSFMCDLTIWSDRCKRSLIASHRLSTERTTLREPHSAYLQYEYR